MQNRSGYTFIDFIFYAIIIMVTLYLFWLTAYNTFTWWKGCSHPMAAVCLGNDFPPGSLILTLIGWIFTKIKLAADTARSLNMTAGLIGAVTSILLYQIIVRLSRLNKEINSFRLSKKVILSVGALGTSLFFAFSKTAWLNSIMFAPYLLTGTFTALIILAMLIWQQNAKTASAFKWIFIIMLLFGLDVSVHRTNLLLLPGFLIMVGICHPKTFVTIKAWINGAIGLVLGLSFHFITMLLATGKPVLNANDPSNWPRFYDYISLKQYGGSWLVNLFPRKAPFLDYQVNDYLSSFVDNMVGSLSMLGFLAPVLGIVGIYILFKSNRKLTLGLIALFLCSSLGSIFYFNVPLNFYWPMDRHYIPSFLIFTIFVGYGLVMLIYLLIKSFSKFRPVVLGAFILIALGLPSMQIIHNYNNLDSSEKYFAYDYGMNILNATELNGIVFVMGDNYWPPAYLNMIEKVRPDITIISTSLTNTAWYIKQVEETDLNLPISWTDEQIDNLNVPEWKDSTIVFRIDANHADFQLSSNYTLGDTVAIVVPPTVAKRFLLIQDQFIIELMKTNKWKRPIYFTNPPSWLQDYIRYDGMLAQLLPIKNPAMNIELIFDNVVNNYNYRGYNDYTINLNKFTKSAGENYYRPFLFLAMEFLKIGDIDRAKNLIEFLDSTIPIDRIDPSDNLIMMNNQIRDSW